jgi:transcriptional regulator with XRE-family HTH domain
MAGLSLSALAQKAGLSKSTLSQLEASQGSPSVETVWAISLALDVPFSILVEPSDDPVSLIRADEGMTVEAERASYNATLLSRAPTGARRDVYRLDGGPGSARNSDPHMAGSREHIILVAGSALVGPADDPAALGPGDYISYPGDVPHTFDALEQGTVAVLIMEHPQ